MSAQLYRGLSGRAAASGDLAETCPRHGLGEAMASYSTRGFRQYLTSGIMANGFATAGCFEHFQISSGYPLYCRFFDAH